MTEKVNSVGAMFSFIVGVDFTVPNEKLDSINKFLSVAITTEKNKSSVSVVCLSLGVYSTAHE